MNISLVHSGALGDTLLLAPLLRSLKQRWPLARRTVVTRPSFGRLLVELSLAEAAANIDDPAHSRWFAAGDIVPRETPAWADCDLLISAISTTDDPWANHARRLSRAGRILFFNPLPPADFRDHVTEFHVRQLAELALPPALLPPVLNNPRGALLIHPGGGSTAKCWPLEQFVLLGHKLARAQRPVEFILGEVELERMDPARINGLEWEFTVHKAPSLTDLVQLLRPAAAYIGNDSGPTHLAATMGLPTVAIFTATNPEQWRPIGPRVYIAKSENFRVGRSVMMASRVKSP